MPLYRVLVGKEPSVEAAQQLAIVLGAENKNVFVVRLDESELKRDGAETAKPAKYQGRLATKLTDPFFGG